MTIAAESRIGALRQPDHLGVSGCGAVRVWGVARGEVRVAAAGWAGRS